MKKIVLTIITIFGITLSGCSSDKQPKHLNQAHEIIRQPEPTIIVNRNALPAHFKLLYGNDPQLLAAFKRYARTGKAPNIKTAGFEKFAYLPEQQPVINCEPFQETIITLESGEKFTSITSGDPQDLSYSVAISGSSSGIETQNVLVKPSLPKMSTNLVIVTDKRVYNILIVVGARSGVTRNVSFWYPQEMAATINDSISKKNDIDMNAEKMPRLDLAKTNFDYKIKYHGWTKPSWYPVRVFDDGKRTWIEFPQGADNKDQPTLLISSDSGQDQKFNTSYYSPYLVVDGVFSAAKLVSGVGSDQLIVDVINKNYVK